MMPIIALSPRAETLGGLNLSWGVTPLAMPEAEDVYEEVDLAVDTTAKSGLISVGDLVAVAAGAPSPRAGGTNLVRIYGL